MSCEMSNEYLMKYFDGDLNDLEEAQFKQHLKTCSKCSEEFNCMSEIMTTVKDTGMVDPPEGFEASVMEKVDKLEKERKVKDSRLLILLYNAATVVSIILLMVFVADLKQVSVFNAFEKIGEYFGSFSSATAAIFGVVGDIFGLISGVVGVILQVAISIVKSYYYVFITLIALLLAIQKLIAVVAAQDGRETR